MTIVGLVVLLLANGEVSDGAYAGSFPDIDTCQKQIHDKLAGLPAGSIPDGAHIGVMCIDVSAHVKGVPVTPLHAPEHKTSDDFPGAPAEGSPDWRWNYNPRITI